MEQKRQPWILIPSASVVTRFFGSRFVLFNLAYDILLIGGTIISDWDPARILAFYWLDICTGIVFYVLYMRWVGHLRNPFKLLVSAGVFVGLMRIYLFLIASIGQLTNQHPGILEQIEILLQPAYEISFFVMLSAFSNLSFYKRLYAVEKKDRDAEFLAHMNIAVMLLMIPGILFLTSVFFAITMNTKLSLIIAYILLRNRFDYWKFKKLSWYGL